MKKIKKKDRIIESDNILDIVLEAELEMMSIIKYIKDNNIFDNIFDLDFIYQYFIYDNKDLEKVSLYVNEIIDFQIERIPYLCKPTKIFIMEKSEAEKNKIILEEREVYNNATSIKNNKILLIEKLLKEKEYKYQIKEWYENKLIELKSGE